MNESSAQSGQPDSSRLRPTEFRDRKEDNASGGKTIGKPPKPDQSEPFGDRIDLDRFLPYLVDRVAESNNRTHAYTLAPLELSREMFRVLTTIEVFGPQNLTDLSAHTSINQSTLSRLIGRMERRKLVRRTRVPGGQTVRIEALPLGRKKNALVTAIGRQFEEALERHLGDDVDELRRLLHKLYDAFEIAYQGFRSNGSAVLPASPRESSAQSSETSLID